MTTTTSSSSSILCRVIFILVVVVVISSSSSITTSYSLDCSAAVVAAGTSSRSYAREAVDRILCPPDEGRDRDEAGAEAYDDERGYEYDDDEEEEKEEEAGRTIRRTSRRTIRRRCRRPAAAMTNDDPRGQYTYGEFPFDSFDALVDRALDFVDVVPTPPPLPPPREQRRHRRRCTMVDLGSGCGRLVLYAALTRGGGGGGGEGKCRRADDDDDDDFDFDIDDDRLREEESTTTKGGLEWDVHGIEIGTRLHSLAIRSLRRGVDRGWFEYVNADAHAEDESEEGGDSRRSTEGENASRRGGMGGGRTMLAFHNGNALSEEDPYFPHTRPSSYSDPDGESSSSSTFDSIRSLLSRTDLIFAYSTVWETSKVRPYDPMLGAMVLSSKWSSALASTCRDGCVAITTDRALDPNDGWKLLDRMDVENPSVWGSVGYISMLDKTKKSSMM